MKRLLQISLSWALLVLSSSANAAAADSVGLTVSAPANGRSVKTGRGFMVPYKMTIPGTEVTFEMIPIPGGKFKMGSPDAEEGREDGEGPQFTVELEPFWMGKYEVTWAEYRRYMALYGTFKEFQSHKIRLVTKSNEIDAITAPTELYDPSFTFEYGEDPALPAVTMTQFAAREYTKWLTAITGQFYRLPCEAEWEYACRAGSQTAYYFGDSADDLGDYAWYYDNSEDSPHQVGLKKPNAWGLYDMHGNVAEMVLDQKLADGFAKFAGKTAKGDEALVWPTKLVPRVVKGGSWEDDPEDCRSAKRLGTEEQQWKLDDPNLPLSPWWFTSDPTRGIGFRIVRPLNEPITRSEKERYWAIDAEEILDAVNNRMSDGRGVRGLVDADLPKAIKELEASR